MTYDPVAIIALLEDVPVSMRELIEIFNDGGSITWFHGVIHQYVPYHADEILAQPSTAVAFRQFARFFEQRYFPLNEAYIDMIIDNVESQSDEDEESENILGALSYGLPLELYGFDMNDLHDIWTNRSPAIPMLAMLPKLADLAGFDEEGIRTSWFDSARAILPVETLRRIPDGGFSCDQIIRAAEMTGDQEISIALHWLLSDTGNMLLDNYYDWEIYPFYQDGWEPELVEHCQDTWNAAEPMLHRLQRYFRRLDDAPQEEFERLLDLIHSAEHEVPL